MRIRVRVRVRVRIRVSVRVKNAYRQCQSHFCQIQIVVDEVDGVNDPYGLAPSHYSKRLQLRMHAGWQRGSGVFMAYCNFALCTRCLWCVEPCHMVMNHPLPPAILPSQRRPRLKLLSSSLRQVAKLEAASHYTLQCQVLHHTIGRCTGTSSMHGMQILA